MGCETVSLADIAVLIPGFSFKSKEFGSGFARAIKIGNISRGINSCDLPIVDTSKYAVGKLGKYQCVRGDYLVAMTGNTIGKIGRMLTGTAYANQRVLKVSGTDKVEPGFLWAALCTTGFHSHVLSHVDSHSAQPNISAKSIGEFKVELPDLATQKRISSVFMSIEEKIEVNNRLNGYLADAVDGLFEKALGQAEEKTLTDVAEILSGGTPKTIISEYWEDGEIPFFGPGDANGSTYCLTTAKRITQLGLENCNSELYPVDTVFLTARGTVGKVAMAGKPMAMNQSCFAFRGLGVSQPAVYQIIKRAVRSLKAKANGATFAAINTRDLKIETILVPSDEELTAFEEEAASLHSMMRVNEEESLKLSSLRDALLPKLIAGEIDVSKIDLTQLNSHLA